MLGYVLAVVVVMVVVEEERLKVLQALSRACFTVVVSSPGQEGT
jgi:hypothetical protein